MKIAFFEVEPWEQETFRQLEQEHEVRYINEPLVEDNADEFSDYEVISVFIYSNLSKEILNKLKNLKFIATRSTGFDHIDIDYCNENDIAVSNVPTYGETTVAEHVFGLIFTISHNLYEAVDRTRRGDFSLKGLRGFDVRGKTLGVIGTGNIGRCVIQTARGLGINVLAFDVHPNPKVEAKARVRYTDMDELLAKSDIITLHVPGNPATENMISEDEFDKMKKGAVLINTSRGNVIDVKALVRALAEGKISAVGLDVLPEEPVIKEEAQLLRSVYQEKYDLRSLLADSVLLRMRNVFITPHSAFNTKEAIQRILKTTLENIQKFSKKEYINIVTEKEKVRKQ
ncbi:MAG: hydroxyacid dehydrogenase [Elusimicrobiota bacterium]